MNPLLRRSAAHAFVESLDDPVLGDEDQHHLLRVLRLRAGESVSVSDGAGAWRSCILVADGALRADTPIVHEMPADQGITIAFAIPKGERPEWIVQKLTEIGVDRIVVLHAERSVIRWDAERAGRHLDKLRRVAREASMQSRRVWLPVVDGPLESTQALAGGAVLAEPGGSPLTGADRFVAIGPEGGWSDRELGSGDRTIDLSGSILRVETAALVAATLLAASRRVTN